MKNFLKKNNLKDILKKFNITFNMNQKRIIYITIILLLFVLLSIHNQSCMIEKIILFALLFLIFLVISENLLITIVLSIFVFLLINLLMIYQKKIYNTVNITERFDNSSEPNIEKKEEHGEKQEHNEKQEPKINLDNGTKELSSILLNNEPSLDLSVLKSDDFLKSSENITELAKKLNGGIEFKKTDLEETKPLGINTKEYSDDKKPNALKDAQKETYELINTVNTLKDTISTLTPVLQEGKKLMEMFETFRL